MSDAVSNNRNWILFADGAYTVTDGSIMTGNVSWAGGYSNDFSQRNMPSQTIINVDSAGFTLENVIDRLQLQNLQLTNTNNASSNQSSYVLKVLDATEIILNAVDVTAFNGGNGSSGTVGLSGASGTDGSHGSNGFCTGGQVFVGAPGLNNFCIGSGGGNGGLPGLGLSTGSDGQSSPGLGGTGGGGGGGPADIDVLSGSFCGSWGGSGGSFAVVLNNSQLTMISSVLTTNEGGIGGNGGAGGLGGIGRPGGNGGSANENSGSGGNGGFGGAGGIGGGGSGGPSIGVVCINNASVISINSTINQGLGGAGGTPNGVTGLSTDLHQCGA